MSWPRVWPAVVGDLPRRIDPCGCVDLPETPSSAHRGPGRRGCGRWSRGTRCITPSCRDEWAFSQPEICCGDHRLPSLSATNAQSTGSVAKRQGLGRRACCDARSSAWDGRYRRGAPHSGPLRGRSWRALVPGLAPSGGTRRRWPGHARLSSRSADAQRYSPSGPHGGRDPTLRDHHPKDRAGVLARVLDLCRSVSRRPSTAATARSSVPPIIPGRPVRAIVSTPSEHHEIHHVALTG